MMETTAVKDTFDRPGLRWIWGSEFQAFNVSDFLAVDIPIPPLPDVDDILERIPGLDDVFLANVEPAIIHFFNSLHGINGNFHDAVIAFKRDVNRHMVNFTQLPQLLPDDYDPPKYAGSLHNVTDVDSETELHTNITKVRTLSSTVLDCRIIISLVPDSIISNTFKFNLLSLEFYSEIHCCS